MRLNTAQADNTSILPAERFGHKWTSLCEYQDLPLHCFPNVPRGQHTFKVSMQNHLWRSGCFDFLCHKRSALRSKLMLQLTRQERKVSSQMKNVIMWIHPYFLNHQVSKWSSCSSTIWLHSKLLLSHRSSRISTKRISLGRGRNTHWTLTKNGKNAL